MPLGNPRSIYGVHDVTIYHRTSLLPYGGLRVLKGSTITLAGELVPLTGGSASGPWSVQDGALTPEIALKPAEIPNWLIQVLLGKAPTQLLANAGNVANGENVLNASVIAATGILTPSVEVGEETNLKFGKYLVVCVSPTTVDVYSLTGIDNLRGDDLAFVDDTRKITATALTIVQDASVSIPNLGVELTGGAGVIAMTIGDTASFEVNPPSNIQDDVLIGELGACVPEFGLIATAEKQSDGSMWLFDCFKVKAFGFPFGMEQKAFNEAEIAGMLQYDSAKNGILKARWIEPSSGCV